MVEPVGGHGGMDYYDFGLCEGLSKTGTQVTLYTCDETRQGDVASCETRLPYRRIYGDDPAWLRGLRYLQGSIEALLARNWAGHGLRTSISSTSVPWSFSTCCWPSCWD
jgi:D-inositol-3-phosphate glycosyltransferase